MTADTQSILCGDCRVPIEGPANGYGDSVFSCPRCGRSDTRENVFKEVKAFVTELAQRSLQKSLGEAVRGNSVIKLDTKPIPKKTHRFVTNHKL